MSCVFPPRAVAAPNTFSTATPTCTSAPGAVRSGARIIAPSVVRRVALGLVVAVALVPRASGAQSTVSVTHSTRHTLRAEIGAVTQAAFLSHQRLSSKQAGLLPSLGSDVQVERAWISTVDVRSNVSGVLLLEPRPEVPGAAPWRVVNAEGQLVPWTSQAIDVSAALAAGRHSVSFVWVAPDGVSAPPEATLRVQPSR